MTYAQSFRIDAIFHSIDPRCHKSLSTSTSQYSRTNGVNQRGRFQVRRSRFTCTGYFPSGMAMYPCARQGRELVGLRRRCDLRLKLQYKQRRNRVHGRQMRSHGCPETGDRYASLGWLPVASKSRCSHILGRSIPYRAKLPVQSAECQLRGDGLRVSTHRYAVSAKCLPARDLDSGQAEFSFQVGHLRASSTSCEKEAALAGQKHGLIDSRRGRSAMPPIRPQPLNSTNIAARPIPDPPANMIGDVIVFTTIYVTPKTTLLANILDSAHAFE
jgi:hypothetical protein